MKQTNNNRHKILVVDDDPDISMMLKAMLEYKDYSVTVLQRAEETIRALEESNIGVTIIDMLLSGTSGIDICKKIRLNNKTAECPVLMISAHPNAKEICLGAGADDFIAKPFDMQEMLSRISNLINKPKNN